MNRRPVKGPWGGGNKTVAELSSALTHLGHEVFYSLDRSDFDVLVCIDPRPNSEGVWYQTLLNYKNQFNSKIIQRVGDVGSHGKPDLFELVKETVKFSDKVVYTSSWAKDIIGSKQKNQIVIPNKPSSIYHKFKKKSSICDTVTIVTQHWAHNLQKGVDTYEFIDKNLKDQVDFTYIGRVPDGFSFKNSRYITPKDNEFLAKNLPNHDIYLTASKEEAGANHVLEGMAAGLPVIYHSGGGSIPEYVGGLGLSFSDNEDLMNTIEMLVKNFDKFQDMCLKYNDTIDETIEEYIKVICET